MGYPEIGLDELTADDLRIWVARWLPVGPRSATTGSLATRRSTTASAWRPPGLGPHYGARVPHDMGDALALAAQPSARDTTISGISGTIARASTSSRYLLQRLWTMYKVGSPTNR